MHLDALDQVPQLPRPSLAASIASYRPPSSIASPNSGDVDSAAFLAPPNVSNPAHPSLARPLPMSNPVATASAAPAAGHILPAAPNIVLVSGAQLRPPLADVANGIVTENDIVEAHQWRSSVSQHASLGHIVDDFKAVALAETYVTQLECLYEKPVVSLADVMAAIDNLTTIVTNNASSDKNNLARLTDNVASLINNVANLTNNVANLTSNISDLTNNVASISRKVSQYGRLSAITFNASCGDGDLREYVVVPNLAGEDPTDRLPLPNLPHIRRLSDIIALSQAQLMGYCNFYGVDPNGTPASILRGIAAAIGVASSMRV